MYSLTKENIKDLVEKETELKEVIDINISNVGNLCFILENLGKLPKEFNDNLLIKLIYHENPKVRLLAVKNIAKVNKLQNLPVFWEAFNSEIDTTTRRELVSAIGRLRKKENKPYLFKILKDKDPKVVCQAIRGLLSFDKDSDVIAKLKLLQNHENETVRSVIEKQFSDKSDIKNKKQSNKIDYAHSHLHDFLKNIVVNADVLEALESVPEESIHLTFTSPPYYNARDYSIYPSYDAYLEFLNEVFKETHRVTKEGRFLIVNTSPIIIPRVSRQHSSKRYPIPFDLHAFLVKNGWEFIDDIVWLKPETSVKNRIGGFMQHRKPLGYKPNTTTEYLMVYRKKTSKLLDWNMRSYSKEIIEASRVKDDYETSNVWKIDPTFDKTHSAIFPTELAKKVIQYYSYVGDVVFDPFAGSGTVGRVAKSLKRNFFLTEKKEEYFHYIKEKLTKADSSLFNNPTKFLSLEEFKNTIKS